MTRFRRKKAVDSTPTKGKTLDTPNTKGSKEQVLQGQVDELQEEMKRLKQLMVAQSHSNNTSPTSTVNFPTPSFAPRPPDMDGLSLSSDQHSRNQSLRKKKGIGGVFVPCEIDFMANESYNHGNSTHRPKLDVSNIFQEDPPPPIREIETRKMIPISHPTSKMKAIHRPKNLLSSQFLVSGDTESTTSSQRSSYSLKNGRKVRRVVRKVRAAKLPEAKSCNTTNTSKTPASSGREDIKAPTVSSSKNKPPARINAHSKFTKSDIATDAPKKNFSTALPSRSKQIKRGDHANNHFTSGNKSNQFDKSRQKAPSPKGGLLADIKSGIKLNKVMKPTEHKHSSRAEGKPNDVHEAILQRCQAERSKATASYHSQAKPQQPKIAIISQPKLPSPRNALLEGIRAGIELKQVDQIENQSLEPSKNSQTSLMEGIKAGVTLKQVDRNAKRPPAISQDPRSALLNGIKAGVKLKQVDRSSLQEAKKKETPMSALLANIQKRKQECLRQQQLLAEDSDADDW